MNENDEMTSSDDIQTSSSPTSDSEPQPDPQPNDESGKGSASDPISACADKVGTILEKCLGCIENHPWESWLEIANGYIDRFLPAVIGLAGALAFVTSFVMFIRADVPFSYVLGTFGLLVATIFSMHLAPKAMALPRSFLEKREPDAMRPELLYILKILLGAGGLIVALWLLLQFNGDALIAALVVAVVSVLLIIVLSHPGLVCTKADYPTNAVEETLSILLLPLKIVLSLLTIVVGLATVILLVAGIVTLFKSGSDASFQLLMSALAPLAVPVGAYVLYLSTVFILDLYRAVVSLPRKLDDLRKSIESK